MDALEAIKKLAWLAREERAPATDVSIRVLMEIRARREPSWAPLWIFAAGSAAVAAGVMGLALHTWIFWNDPLVDLFAQFQMVML